MPLPSDDHIEVIGDLPLVKRTIGHESLAAALAGPEPIPSNGRETTEHRCKDGSWKPGRIADCPVCRPPRPQTFLPTGDLPGKRASTR